MAIASSRKDLHILSSSFPQHKGNCVYTRETDNNLRNIYGEQLHRYQFCSAVVHIFDFWVWSPKSLLNEWKNDTYDNFVISFYHWWVIYAGSTITKIRMRKHNRFMFRILFSKKTFDSIDMRTSYVSHIVSWRRSATFVRWWLGQLPQRHAETFWLFDVFITFIRAIEGTVRMYI